MAYRRIGLALMLFFATTPGAWADDTLKALASDWPEAQVTETLSHGNDLALEQGSRFSLRVASTQGAHLAILFENPRGEVRVFVPRRTDTGDLIIPGSEINYPDMASGETLYADSPVGKAFVYLIATEQPAFGGSKVIAGDPHPWTDAHQVLALLGQPAVGRKTVTRLLHIKSDGQGLCFEIRVRRLLYQRNPVRGKCRPRLSHRVQTEFGRSG
jgi:hypothetical protein